MFKSEGKRDKAISAWKQTSFSAPQALVFIVPSIASVVAFAWYYLNIYAKSANKTVLPNTPAERLAFAIRLEFYPLATLVLAIHWVWLHRVWYPMTRNPLSGHEYLLETASRILSNTVEQFMLHAFNVLVFAVVAPSEKLHLIRLAVFMFTVGRVAFGVGYTMHAKYRIPGFVWTFLPSMALFAYNSVLVARQY